MAWIAFGFHGKKINAVLLFGGMSELTYQNIREENLLSFTQEICGSFWMFRQDNESIHMANSSDNGFLMMVMLIQGHLFLLI